MKKITLLLALLVMHANADLSVADIDHMIVKIHKKREGILLKTLDLTKEPFVRLEEKENVITVVIPNRKKKKTTDVSLVLHSILNARASINGSWVKIGEDVLGYKLMFIGKRGVVLRNENHIKKLFLKKEKNSLIHVEKR